MAQVSGVEAVHAAAVARARPTAHANCESATHTQKMGCALGAEAARGRATVRNVLQNSDQQFFGSQNALPSLKEESQG